MHLLRSLALSLLALALTAAAPDTFTRAELEALEAERRSAIRELEQLQSAGEVTVRDLRTLDQQLLSAAMEVRRREEQAAASERALIDLGMRRRRAAEELLTSEVAYEDLVAALAAANRRRPPALVVTPDQSGTAIRRAILMRTTLPQLEGRAAAISADIERLNRLEQQIFGEQARLDAAEATLALKREEIEQLAAVKRRQAEDVSGDMVALRARADRLGRQADTLRDLLAALQSEAPPAPGIKPAARPQLAAVRPPASSPPATGLAAAPATRPLARPGPGVLRQPVAGDVLQRFGDQLPSGGAAQWIKFNTRAEAQVIAPTGGTVEYARPFRSYGSMLILRTIDGYHVILTGMSRIYVSEGQAVTAGEPVGRMPDRADPPPELSLELRLGDRILNPAEWLARGG
jgi:septal ring factor EnvC (AmiA/AmiB activator)